MSTIKTEDFEKIRQYLVDFHNRHFEKVEESIIDEESSTIYIIYKDDIFNKHFRASFKTLNRESFIMSDEFLDVSHKYRNKPRPA